MDATVTFNTSRKIFIMGLLAVSSVFSSSYTLADQDASEVAPILPSDPASLAARVGMKWIEDAGMGNLVAQGFMEDLDYLDHVVDTTGPTDQAPEIALMSALQIAIPFLQLITDYEITGVEYDDPLTEKVIFNPDSTVTLILPDRIGAITYKEFQARDSSGEALGDLMFNDITLYEGSKIILHNN